MRKEPREKTNQITHTPSHKLMITLSITVLNTHKLKVKGGSSKQKYQVFLRDTLRNSCVQK